MSGNFPYKTNLADDFYNSAPRDQIVPIKFAPGWQFTMKGLLPEQDYHHEINIALPFIQPKLTQLKNKQQTNALDMQCDTLVVEGDSQSFSLIWRKSIKISQCGLAEQFCISKNNSESEIKDII